MIISKPSLKIVATILAKDEEDIIAQNIEHHISQGVSQFIITNNRSKDKTAEIASRYKEVVEIIEEPDETHNQSRSVTRMAQLACKLNPDWIIHLDADELWCGLSQLRNIEASAFGSVKMYLHPPKQLSFNLEHFRHYLDFKDLLPEECKVGHRPDPDIQITHGNHAIVNREMQFTQQIWRHHYPIRSYKQFLNKTIDGHLALMKRNAPCERWKKWYDLFQAGTLDTFYDHVCNHWETMIDNPNTEAFMFLLNMWATPEVVRLFQESKILPSIGQWPRKNI
jgi:glycosyltransferase involved in cell wall biosynthesis